MGVITLIFIAMATTLREEIGQTRPFGSAEEEAFLAIQRTAARLAHALAETFRPFGLTATQYNVLRILRGAGEAGLCRNEVRDRMITQVPDVSRLLDRMEEMGVIERSREGADRRFVTTRITAEGSRLLSELDGPVADCHRRLLGHLGEESLRSLAELLARARERA
jgi:MarR family transcriptional regulator, 2-MHQ and catechol-resistance regulon repressor